MAIIVSLLVFGFVILIHELGHFLAARKSGIGVEEFAIGMGPLLFSKQGESTLYTVRLFPIGGFCKMVGEDENDEDNRPDDSFNSKSVWARIFVITGGVIMNTILAFIIFFGFNLHSGFAEPVVKSVMDGYPAQQAGLQTGDRIYSIDGYKIQTRSELMLRIDEAAKKDLASGEQPIIDLVYLRDGNKINVEMPLKQNEDSNSYLLGFNVNAKTGIFGEEVDGFDKATFGETVGMTFHDMSFIVESTMYGLKQLFVADNALQQVSGPIGMIDAIGTTYDDSVEAGGFSMAFYNMLYIMALISANLAVFNLLPLPALDGGRLVFLLIEAITGKSVPPEKEAMVHFIGFVILIGFAIIVAFSDIYKLF